ncbi:MAG: endonuclease domain-containing protein [Patescibacteria group bacterium]
MKSYNQFIFKSFVFDRDQKTLTLNYGIDDAFKFQETYRFDFDFVDSIDEQALDRAFQLLFMIAGVSYYKTFIPPEIVIEAKPIDNEVAEFLSRTYQNGLGEFFYINQLDPLTPIAFPAQISSLPIKPPPGDGLMIGIGGGKDSLVSVELLHNQPKVATWSLNHRPQLEPLIRRIGLPHFWVEREIDPHLIELKDSPDAYNGHVPISAIFAAVGVIVALLSGYHDSVVSNESSASEPNLDYKGVAINHQYSKSIAFEEDFQAVMNHLLSDAVRYYSFLRPLTELHISELFARTSFVKYQAVFSSCNSAFTLASDHMFWDGTCPKCAFVFLALTPFVDRDKLEKLFGGKNLLLDPALVPTYQQLLGMQGNKPLECVGEIKESRAAMRIAQQQYSELNKYVFELPGTYDYRSLSNHKMPPNIFEILKNNTHL